MIDMTRTEIDQYVIDTLMRDLCGHDRQPSAFLVYLFLYRWTEGVARKSATVSLRDIAEETGLSKRSVQSAISRLHARKLISIAREGMTDIPAYTVLFPWRRPAKRGS